MKVLILGSGGREHALGWKIASSPRVEKVYSCPGNGGLRQLGPCWGDVSPTDSEALIARIRAEQIDWVVVGPEAPLAAGVSDDLQRAGIKCTGPGRAGSQLEASKAFSKDFMSRHGIPTAPFRVVEHLHDVAPALAHFDRPVVVKADGLAAGKGVVVTQNHEQAERAAIAMLSGEAFGGAGRKVVIEERLEGEEMTLLLFVSGRDYICLESARDYKPLSDGNQGPNTGGMGAYSPSGTMNAELQSRIVSELVEPTLEALAREDIPYRGVLYLGLMLTKHGPRLLEYNVRFGDPETQPLLMRLRTDLMDVYEAIDNGTLGDLTLEWDPRSALCLVLASKGYPGAYPTGVAIHGCDDATGDRDAQVFHAGTRWSEEGGSGAGELVTSGGRVLGVTALGDDLQQARARAYAAADAIRFDGKYHRSDIGT